MAKGSVSSDAALVESPLVLAIFSKILRLQMITVLRTDSRVKGGVEDVAGLIAHRHNLVSLLIFSDKCLIKLTWVLRNSSGSVRNSLNSEH